MHSGDPSSGDGGGQFGPGMFTCSSYSLLSARTQVFLAAEMTRLRFFPPINWKYPTGMLQLGLFSAGRSRATLILSPSSWVVL